MNIKKKSYLIDLKLINDFFQTKLNRWSIFSLSILLICIFAYYEMTPDLYFFPGNNKLNFTFYNDSANGGNSKIIRSNISDSAIKLDFNLNKGFLSPYVGICIFQKDNRTIDLSDYNQFKIAIDANEVKSISVVVYCPNPYYKSSPNSKDLCFITDLEISDKQTQHIIDLNQLRIPDWCCTINNIPPDKHIKPDLSKILNINISSSYTPNVGTKSSICIHSISFGRNNQKLILILIAVELSAFLLLFMIHYLKALKKFRAKSVTINYKAIDVENENNQLKSFMDYINTHFSDASLSLEQVSDITGINQRRIANSIQQSFGCNFKTYLNQLRINESKRLLKETELNMGEIAYKVGFNNQSHFNRVFKSLTEISPSQYRESN